MGRPKKTERNVRQSVSFEAEQLKRLMRYCQREERTISWCVRKAMNEWLKDKGV